FLQIPLLILGAWSMLRARAPSMRTVSVSMGCVVAAAFLAFSLSSFSPHQIATSVIMRSVVRNVALAGAFLFCTYVFVREWSQRYSWASGISAAFCLLYAVNRGIYCWIYAHRFVLEGSTSHTFNSFGAVLIAAPRLYFLNVVYVCGICLGMVLLLVEEHERTENALSESDSRTREVAASNAALQDEIVE